MHGGTEPIGSTGASQPKSTKSTKKVEIGVPTRTFTDHDRTVLVTLWPNGQMDVQTRPSSNWDWSMPVRCLEELPEDAA